MNIVITYFLTLVSLVVLDSIWIGFLAKKFYTNQIGFLFRDSVIWTPLVFFYLFYAALIIYFVISPSNTIIELILKATFFGFAVYMTYDLVNYATLQGFSLKVVFVDIFWGIFMTAIASLIGWSFLK